MIYSKNQIASGVLYIIATPIGNLDDISKRAVDILQKVDYLICEDTRVTAKLLHHLGLKKSLMVCNDHTEKANLDRIIADLHSGKMIGMVSDAGTPLISDPGYLIVNRAKEEDLRVVPIPGSCAAITALCASGMQTSRFTFVGFLNKKSGMRKRELEELKYAKEVLIFYVPLIKVQQIINEMLEIWGLRVAVLARELTKVYEEIHKADLAQMLEYCKNHENLKGEAVLIVEGAKIEQITDDEIVSALHQAMQNMSMRDAVKHLTKHFKLSKSRVYKLALECSR